MGKSVFLFLCVNVYVMVCVYLSVSLNELQTFLLKCGLLVRQCRLYKKQSTF